MLPPKQLRNNELRFCKVGVNGKRAFEKAFNTKENAYTYTSCELFGRWCMSKKGNYGVLCGYGNLFVLDFDDEETYQKAKKQCKLPPTFTVRSASKGLPHLYYIADDVKSFQDVKTVLFDKISNPEEVNVGKKPIMQRIIDVQGMGKYVVGPGSKIDDKSYKIVSPHDITKVSYETIIKKLRAVFPHIHVAKTNKMPKAVRWNRTKRNDEVQQIKDKISMPKLLRHYGSNTSKMRCECPVHTHSVSQACVAFNEDVFYCFHGMHGGDVFTLVMETESCSFPDAKKYLERLI